MDLALHLASNDKIIARETTQNFKSFKCQSLLTQAERAEELVPCLPAIEKGYSRLGDEIMELNS